MSIQKKLIKVANFLWFKLSWVGLIVTGDQYLAAFAVALGIHIITAQSKTRELQAIILCGTMGIALDSAISIGGFYEFIEEPRYLPVPYWLLMIWFSFAGTLRGSLSLFVSKPFLGAAFGAVIAPMSYLGASRLGAVSFPDDLTQTLLVISLGWALAMLVFSRLISLINSDQIFPLKTRPQGL